MRKDKPTGKEISEKSKKIKLNEEEAIEEKKEGKKVKFTPNISKVESMEELEDGFIVGVFEHEFEAKEKTLPPGKYNVFIAKVNGEWQGFAESDGIIKGEAAKVSIERHYWEDLKKTKPSFEFKSICSIQCVRWCNGHCLVTVTTCYWVWIFC